ncbi:MAG: ABC-F family ATP-binding cassette domain-containing protein [Labilithrix sp.]|nr:ABC-F family ATP-binding cassette domain-containing protein [Labilithrix sp.]
MVVLEARGVGVAWTASVPVLRGVSFALSPGFYGLVGANGAGKTTLLRVLAGELAPHEGAVRTRPEDATIAYARQAVDELDADVTALAESHDGVAAELKGRLALDEAELARWPTLSPGERKRWQIGAALAREPDVLLLDEPTNHLDGDARARLLGALSRFRGVGVIVSHDRAVLERLPRSILRVHGGAVTLHAGSYGEARAAWEEARRGEEAVHARAKAAVRAVERRLDAARRTQEAASRSLSASARMKGKNDHDARSMGRKVSAGWAEGRAGRSVEIAREGLERARAAVPEIERDRTLGGQVFAAWERAPQPVLFHLDAPELRAGDRVVLRDVRVTIGRDERVRVTGDNGAGKTTLLAALLATRRGDRLLHLPQELPPEAIAALTSELRSLPADERGRVLSVFSALGSDPERLLLRRELDAAALSPGEARKLALASGLGRHAWALVLDEPTNHLDLPTIERLERALEGYPGCVVLVTHDDAFARAVTTRRLDVRDGAVV